jgi:hypothetical protein
VRADDATGALKLLDAGVVEEAAVDAVEALNLSVLAEMRRSQENVGIFSPWSHPNPTASRNSASKLAP